MGDDTQFREPSEEELAALERERRERDERGAALVQASKREYEAMLGWEKIATQADWDAAKARALESWHSGVRLVEMLGGERYLAPERAALLVILWRQYVERYRPTSPAEYQAIAAALVAWHHFERVNELVGNLAVRAETHFFSSAPLEVQVVARREVGYYERQDAHVRAEEFLRELGQGALPLLDRLQRMMTRSLRLLRELQAMPRQEQSSEEAQRPIPLARRQRA